MEKIEKNKNVLTLVNQCYAALREDILNGVFEPGQKLKVVPLKEYFKVGQSPIREALSRLTADGLVTMENNKGFRVSILSEKDMYDTCSILTMVTNMALTRAIECATKESEASIVSELYKLSLVEKSNELAPYTVWAECNYNFHMALIAGCGSPLLLDIYRIVYAKFDRYCRIAYSMCKTRLKDNHEEHVALTNAVLNKEKALAHKLNERHIHGACKDVIKILKKNKRI